MAGAHNEPWECQWRTSAVTGTSLVPNAPPVPIASFGNPGHANRAALCVNALNGVPDDLVEKLAIAIPEIPPTLRGLLLALLGNPNDPALSRALRDAIDEHQGTVTYDTTPIDELLPLDKRIRNALKSNKVLCIGDLLNRTADDLLNFRRFGMTALTQVREALSARNLHLRGE